MKKSSVTNHTYIISRSELLEKLKIEGKLLSIHEGTRNITLHVESDRKEGEILDCRGMR